MSEAFESAFGQPSVSEAVSDPVAETPAELTRDGQQRDEQGRFAQAAPSEPVAAETPSSATPDAPADQHAPISALLDERDKRKAAQAERDAFAKELADLRASQSPREPQAPEERHQAELHDLRQKTQRLSVEVDHGKKTVQEAFDWAFARCDKNSDKFDPAFNAQMHAQMGLIGNPYQVAVEAHKQHAELEEFNAWKATRNNPPADPAPAAQTPQSTPATPVPRSLADAPGNGAAGVPHVPVGPGQAFAAVIRR